MIPPRVRIGRHAPAVGILLATAVGAHALGTIDPGGWLKAVHGVIGLPARAVIAALGLTALSFMLLCAADQLALRQVLGARCPAWTRCAPASLVSHAIGQGVGFAVITGGVMRQRFYARLGISTSDTVRVVALVSGGAWIAASLAVSAALVLAPGAGLTGAGLTGARLIVNPLHGADPRVLRTIGFAGLVAVTGLLTAFAVGRRAPARWIPAGTGRLASTVSIRAFCAQLALGALDWGIASAALWTLLPDRVAPGLFVTMFIVAQALALMSHVPGGIGVFELIMAGLLAPWIAGREVAVALIAFRIVYYAVPAMLAVVALVTMEAWMQRDRVRRLSQRLRPIVPTVLAGATFAAGVVLLGSSATPPVARRAAMLRTLVPATVMDSAYVSSSLVGAALLLVARGVQRRLGAARVLAMLLLAGGMVASLLKGLDAEEALVLGAVLLAFVPARTEFDRSASLVAQRFTPPWIVAIASSLGGTLWLAQILSHRLGGTGPLAFHSVGSASRAVLSTTAAAAACAFIGLARLLRPAQPAAPAPDEGAQARARRVVDRTPETAAHLAFVGDKALLFNDDGSAFLMYGIAGQSWIAMGDPVGPPSERAGLVRRFSELAHRHGGRAVFYHVTPGNLPLYVELGLTLRKIGESARVPLQGFTLDGGERKWLRRARRNAAAAGCRFELVPQSRVVDLLPALRKISDAWLRRKRAREKRFSLGYFDDRYIGQCPVGVVWQGGRIVAFANLWIGSDAHELSVDLMRYLPDSPPQVIDFLFGELLLWGAGQGFEWFDLGVAPLAGLQGAGGRLLWNRLGALLYRRGAAGYDFEGVRRYKAKFSPQWSPRYIAGPSGLAMARAAADVAAIIGGAVRPSPAGQATS